mgnify:CR=1 FL=1
MKRTLSFFLIGLALSSAADEAADRAALAEAAGLMKSNVAVRVKWRGPIPDNLYGHAEIDRAADLFRRVYSSAEALPALRVEAAKGLAGRTLRGVSTSLAASVGAIVFTTPLSALYFGFVPLYSVLTNLLCLWAMSLAFMLGYPVCLLGMAWKPLGRICGWIAGGLYWRYYPTIKHAPFTAMTVCFYLAYAALCLTPVILNGWEDRKWKQLRSEI